MLRVSKLTDYAMVIMAHFAVAPDAIHQASELAELTGIARPTSSKLLKILTKCGFLVSHRGASGGYQLARDPDEISIVDLLEALEGPFALTECAIDQDICAVAHTCVLKSPWQRINAIIFQTLSQIKLSDLTKSRLPVIIGEQTHESTRHQ